jgi:hydrogenase maturation factor
MLPGNRKHNGTLERGVFSARWRGRENLFVVLGLGNLLRRDEGLGIRALEHLQARYALPNSVQLVDGGTLGLDLLSYLEEAEKHFGRVEVLGSTRPVHFGMLEPEAVQIGTWVLISAGWAIRSLEADEASQTLQCIKELERQCEEEQT